jgi:hypothetical protein
MQIKKSAQSGFKHSEDKSALPREETPFQHLPVCINKGSQCLIYSLTQLTHLVRKFEGSCSYQLPKGGGERGALRSRGYSLVFGLLSWHCVGYLY